jgi:hypothetical protein
METKGEFVVEHLQAPISDEQVARITHEVNKAWCEHVGDHSQLPWDQAPEWQRASAISGVVFHRENPDAGDAAGHINWLKDKAADGWSYGPIKDEVKKQHPCFVPYEELTAIQKFKDRLFRTVVHASS